MALYHGSVSFNGTKDIKGSRAISLVSFKNHIFCWSKGKWPRVEGHHQPSRKSSHFPPWILRQLRFTVRRSHSWHCLPSCVLSSCQGKLHWRIFFSFLNIWYRRKSIHTHIRRTHFEFNPLNMQLICRSRFLPPSTLLVEAFWKKFWRTWRLIKYSETILTYMYNDVSISRSSSFSSVNNVIWIKKYT